MRHNLYIPDETWESMKAEVERGCHESISGYIRYLHDLYISGKLGKREYTHTKNTGKTLSDVSRETDKCIGRESSVGDDCDGVMVYPAKRVGGILRLSISEIERISPELADKIRSMGECRDDSVVEFHEGVKSDAVATIKKDLDEIMGKKGGGVRPYTKERQLGKRK